MRLAAVALALFLVTPAAAQTVVDGDTIKLEGTTWRLWGIDVPETKQASLDGWPAGIEAIAALRRLMEGARSGC